MSIGDRALLIGCRVVVWDACLRVMINVCYTVGYRDFGA
jgi:hypothetical protein